METEKSPAVLDKPALEALFKLHYAWLVNVASRLLRDEAVAKDVVQDVFIKLWKNREQITAGPYLKSYLYKATTHASLNYLESQKRKLSLKHDIQRQGTETAPEDADSLATKELQARIEEALDRLPPKCRAIFLLSRQEGMKYQQIAEHLGLSPKTVENQMGIALEKLRQELKPFLTREFLLTLLVGVLLAGLLGDGLPYGAF